MQELEDKIKVIDEYISLIQEVIKYKRSVGLDTLNDSKELGKAKKFKQKIKK